MLWVCLHFSDFSLQLTLRASPSAGPTIITTGGNRPEVLSCNAQARRYGIAPGMTVSAAIALAPELVERARDPASEMKALEGAAAWAGQFTSMVSLAQPDTLLLEIEGSLRLFGGLRPLLLHLGRDLADLGYTAAIAAAPTPTAARLLARAAIGSIITDIAGLQAALAGLPLSLLDQPEDVIRMLALMGVHTIGECLALPRDGLARRFGQALLDELDRALGRLPDPRAPWAAPSRYRAKLALPAPVQETAPLLFAANRLIQELAGYLRTKQAGVTRLKLVLRHADRRPTSVTLGFSVPSRDPHRILTLLRERLSSVTLPDRVEAIALESAETRPLGSRNLSLFPEDRLPEEERWLIIEHLRARLGSESVYSITSHPDHRPELAWRCCEPGASTGSDERAKRPLWLMEPPQRLRSEGELPVLGTTLTLLAGPERIESGWWDGKDVLRDYFVACDAAGGAFWVFRERNSEKAWFLQGMFA
ncbi:MAG TPA: DNA polymerase Y family protein [Burkholderiales bacterium]|nr:DNA polymerase Y family protein [Burkholderiales bacterium]